MDLLLSEATDSYMKMVPERCRIIDFNSNRIIFSLGKLVKYLNKNNPFALISVLSHANVVSSLAKMFYNTKIILTERINLTSSKANLQSLCSKLLPLFMFLTYRKTDKVVAVIIEETKNLYREILEK